MAALARQQVPLSAARRAAGHRGRRDGSRDGKRFLRILEFDVAKGEYTGKSFKYTLEAPGNAIGDFNLIDATSGLIIERDDTEGDMARACPDGAAKPDCFNVPAKFKQIYKIDLAQADADGFVKKVGYIDLMDIQDPNKRRRAGRQGRQAHLPVLHHRERRHDRCATASLSAATTTCPSRRAARSASPTITS